MFYVCFTMQRYGETDATGLQCDTRGKETQKEAKNNGLAKDKLLQAER